MTEKLKAPFPYPGGKGRVADVVWPRFGADAPNYIEPFAGSAAMLLARGCVGKIETLNDIDADIANFWRATTADPEAVAHYCDRPVNEADMHAIRAALVSDLEVHRRRMHEDIAYFDAKRAGWWVWGMSISIGNNWMQSKGERAKPHLHANMQGVAKSSLQLGNAGRGVRKMLGSVGPKCVAHASLIEWFEALRNRLRRVRVLCGDWARAVSSVVLGFDGGRPCAVFLDPPYAAGRDKVYSHDSFDVFEQVRSWAIEHGDDPTLRIAICGYDFDMPAGWDCHAWKAQGGMANIGNARGRTNAAKEQIWFSPHCLRAGQVPLFGVAT